MTLKESLTLQHNKYIAYAQIWAGFCLAILAADYFNVLEIRTVVLQSIVFNNWLVALGCGVMGLYFFRVKLKEIEWQVAHRNIAIHSIQK